MSTLILQLVIALNVESAQQLAIFVSHNLHPSTVDLKTLSSINHTVNHVPTKLEIETEYNKVTVRYGKASSTIESLYHCRIVDAFTLEGPLAFCQNGILYIGRRNPNHPLAPGTTN